MPWRKSLLVTAILVAIDFGLGQLQNLFFTFILTANPQNMDFSQASFASFATVVGLIGLLIFGVFTFFVISWALHGQRRTGKLRAQHVLDLLDEEQVRELKNLLIAPSQRAE
jgi:hypothetical protein